MSISFIKRLNDNKNGLLVGFDKNSNLLHFAEYSYTTMNVENSNRKAIFLNNESIISMFTSNNLKKNILQEYEGYDNIVFINLHEYKCSFLSGIMKRFLYFLKNVENENFIKKSI